MSKYLELSDSARGLLEVLWDEYMEDGFLDSGSWPIESLSGEGFGKDDIQELLAAGLIQRRDCRACAYELTPTERKRLIAQHDLGSVWFEKYHLSLEEIQDEVQRAAAIPERDGDIEVPVLKNSDDKETPDMMVVVCPFRVGQIIEMEYDLPKQLRHIGYATPVESSPGKAVGKFMVTDVVRNQLVWPRMNMIELQSLCEEFNKVHPTERTMQLFEDVVLKRARNLEVPLADKLQDAGVRSKQSEPCITPLDENFEK